jgi:hypothetical protein
MASLKRFINGGESSLPQTLSENGRESKRRRLSMSDNVEADNEVSSECGTVSEHPVLPTGHDARTSILSERQTMHKDDMEQPADLAPMSLRYLRDTVAILPNEHPVLEHATEIAIRYLQDESASIATKLGSIKVLQMLVKKNAIRRMDIGTLVSALHKCLVEHADNTDLVKATVGLIRKLKSFVDRHELSNITAEVVVAIRRNMDDLSVQQLCLVLLAWLVEDAICRERIANAENFELLLDIMDMHVEDKTVVCNGTAVASWLVHFGRTDTQTELSTRGFAVLVKCLQQHMNVASAFGNCVCALCAYTGTIENETILAPLIYNGMTLHVSSAKVQEACLRWFRLCHVDAHVQILLQVIPHIESIMQRYHDNNHLQIQACDALTVMASNPSLCKCLYHSGVVDMAMSAFKLHKADKRVQQSVVGLLVVLTVLAQANPSIGGVVSAFGGGLETVEIIWKSQCT